MADGSGTPAYDPDRQNSLLTTAQRKWLIEHTSDEAGSEPATDAERAQARQNRYRIRDRLRNGIQDFTLLLALLPDGDRRDAFAPRNVEDDEAVALSAGVQDLLAFVYLCHRDHDWDFDAALITAFHRVAAEHELTLRDVFAETVFEVFDPNTEDLKARFDARKPPMLESHELQALMDQEVIDTDEALIYRAEMRAQRRETNETPQSPVEQLDALHEKIDRRVRARRSRDEDTDDE